MKAWAVKIKGCPEFDHIAWGISAAKVRHQGVLASKDAGYCYGYAEILVRRAPWCDTTKEQDDAALKKPTEGAGSRADES